MNIVMRAGVGRYWWQQLILASNSNGCLLNYNRRFAYLKNEWVHLTTSIVTLGIKHNPHSITNLYGKLTLWQESWNASLGILSKKYVATLSGWFTSTITNFFSYSFQICYFSCGITLVRYLAAVFKEQSTILRIRTKPNWIWKDAIIRYRRVIQGH